MSLNIRKPNSVTVLDASGNGSTVTSISSSTGSAGTSFAVTIQGYGFVPGQAVTFERGNGPRPVASSVIPAEDTKTLDTITGIVTIPYKRNLGRDPVWDVKIGSSAVPPGAFTVTR